MNRREFLSTGALALAGPLVVPGRLVRAQTAASPFPSPGADGWSPLFNGRNFDGWYKFLNRSGKNSDPGGYIRIDEGMIHMLGIPVTKEVAEAGYLATIQEFSNYHLRLEFKWGSARFPPRALAKRDSGLYFHLVGPDRAWPTGMQLQIQETDLGDILPVNGIHYVTANSPGGNPPWPNPPSAANAVACGGPGQPRVWKRLGDFEKLEDWNSLEIIVREDRAAFLVNGRIVNTMFNMQAPDPPAPALPAGAPASQQIPADSALVRLDRGRIALEVEFAEIWFRNIEIRPLGGGE